MDKYAVIMAGGSGTRLWPISRKNKPKQFICVNQDKSMLLMTLKRITKTIPGDKCYVITDKNLFNLTLNAVKAYIPEGNIMPEPEKKNTAACITYAAMLLKEKFGRGLVCFIPADSYIDNIYDAKYMTALFHAFNAAEKSNSLAVIGINPTYPATGYGYIKFNPKTCLGSGEIFKVERFVEKPTAAVAKEYVDSGEYLWNSGMVFGTFEAVLDSVERHLPGHFRLFSEALAGRTKPDAEASLDAAYAAIDPVSFDIGVLEKCEDLYVIRGFFAWNDIGSLVSMSDTFIEDADGNRVSGYFYGIDSGSNVIYGGKDLITAIGVKDLVIVHAGDAILVCPKERAQEVRRLVEELIKNGYETFI